jgi:hypothetical protein
VEIYGIMRVSICPGGTNKGSRRLVEKMAFDFLGAAMKKLVLKR